MKQFALRLDEGLYRDLQTFADITERSTNGLIVFILRNYIQSAKFNGECSTREHYNSTTVASSAAAPNDTEECRR